jgi:hypothetical protein
MILKLALLSCALYVGVAILMEGGLLLWARLAGSVAFSASRTAWFLLFGIIWLGSFSLAWHIVLTGLRAKLPH